LPARAALIGAQLQPDVYKKLSPLQSDLLEENNALIRAIGTITSDKQMKLRVYNNAINRLTKMLDYIRKPTDAASATADQIMLFEQKQCE